MKVVLTAPGFFPASFGGGEVYVYRLARELIGRGHDVTVVIKAAGSSGAGEYRHDGIRVVSFAVDPATATQSENHSGYGPCTVSLLTGLLHDLSADVVHVNGIKAASVEACNRLGIPALVTAHHAGIVCPAGSMVRRDASVCGMSAHPGECVPCCSFQRRPRWYTGGLIGGMPAALYRAVGRRLDSRKQLSYVSRGLIYPWLVEADLQAAGKVREGSRLTVVPSQWMFDLLARCGYDPARLVRVAHGIEPVAASPAGPPPGSGVRFGYIGRIEPLKGLHILLQAAAMVPADRMFEVHIFGGVRNPWDEEYRRKTLDGYHGAAPVTDHGLVSHDRIADAYAGIDVLVVPSLIPEAFGLVVAEAFSAGRPVIVFDSGGLSEQVHHAADGFVVPDKTATSLAAVMRRFMDDPGLVHEMAAHLPAVTTIRQHTDRIEELYERLVREMASGDRGSHAA